MSQRKRFTDEMIAAALVGGATIDDAAFAHGCSAGVIVSYRQRHGLSQKRHVSRSREAEVVAALRNTAAIAGRRRGKSVCM